MEKIIFIDRDGTLIIEPTGTKLVSCLEEMTFLPKVISSLAGLRKAGFKLVIITNQSGLGTPDNPRDNYELINRKMLEVFKGEDVIFSEFFECPHSSKDKCECRKPKTGMVKEYLINNDIDLENSYVIGDRHSDMEFAENINVKGLLLSEKQNWEAITNIILKNYREK